MRRDETGKDRIKQQQKSLGFPPFILLFPVSSRLILFQLVPTRFGDTKPPIELK
jgi:hypothetical protein